MTARGLGKGLAVKHDFAGDIQRIYQREALDTQARVEKERKTQMYGEMLKKGHVRGANNTRELEGLYKGVNNELANFVTENPGWETDPGLFAQFSEITNQYLENDIIREDVQVEQQFQTLQQHINSGNMNLENIEANMTKYTNYLENGGDPYMFTNPKEFEYADILDESMGDITYNTATQKRETEYGVDMEKSVTKATESSIQLAINTAFINEGYAREMEKDWKQAGGRSIAETPQQWHENNIRARLQYDETKETANRLQYANYVAGSQNDPVPASAALRDVITPALRVQEEWAATNDPEQKQKIEDDYNTNAISRPLAIALTMYREENKNKSLSPSDGALLRNQKGEISKFEHFAERTISTGSKKPVLHKGKMYIELDVVFSLPSGTSKQNLKKTLENNNFSATQLKFPGWNDVGKGVRINEENYAGTILMLTISDIGYSNAYDNKYFGTAENKIIRASGQYEQAEARDALSQYATLANERDPTVKYKAVDNNIISADAFQLIDPLTGETYIKE